MTALLAARTHFSIGESILPVKKLIELGKSVGAKAIATTDTMSITSMIEFAGAAKKAEIKPIVGCRLRLTEKPEWRKTKDDKKAPPEYFVTVYVKSEAGLKWLFAMLSRGNSEERFYNNAKLSFDDLLDALPAINGDDLCFATGDAGSIVQYPKAREIVLALAEAVGAENVYLTLTPVDTPFWDTMNKRTVYLGRDLVTLDETHLPYLVSRPVFYGPGDADAGEIMTAITRNEKMSDPWHNSMTIRDFHPHSFRDLAEETKKASKRLVDRGIAAGDAFSQGLRNTALFADRIPYEWKKAPVSLPAMAADEFAEVVAQCKKGWSERFALPIFAHQPSKKELEDVYKPRLKYELETLKKLNFSGYFLLVQDVVQFAKKNGILVGPGRGSVGGSLVAYLMGITDCDPIRFGLLFERFINPDRIDLPDADLDFMSARRHEVIEYLIDKYGREQVAGVSNYLKLAAASTIQGVGKAFGLPDAEYRCSKFVPKKHGQPLPLPDSAEQVPEIEAFAKKYPPLWENMVKLEGSMKTLATHAAGIVVGGVPLVERAVVEQRKGEHVVCWDKRIVEDQGLVKMDILGLSTLDLIDLTLYYIRKRHSKKVDLMRIPLDDPKVLENFANHLTTGIFQFESGGMRRLLRELGSDGNITFDDITAATALYRPGPMESGMMDSYFLRKQGRETVEYDHPLMEPILAPTFGVMVYQEQVMQVARVIAGYSAPDADKLRKIMGKKLPEEMKKERGKFVDGVVKTVGESQEWAGALFDKIEGFAGYGFNKSHSVEYTLISYQSMWLKTYFPVEFFAAALSLMKEDILPALIRDAQHLGIKVSMPDINHSTGIFEIITDTELCIPFNRIKGVGDKTVDAILAARASGKFKDKADFIARVEKRNCNVRHQGALDLVGAFARIEPGQLPADHPDRIKDQRELLPGLISQVVPVRRDLHKDPATKEELAKTILEYRTKHGPAGDKDGLPTKPFLGKNARFMAIFDAPGSDEEEHGISYGKSFGTVSTALAEHSLQRIDGYWTALIKRCKSGKQVSPSEIKTYEPYLRREIELLKPPVIVLMGSIVVRHFFPDFKGKASDAAGTVIYSKDLDANFVIGFNPGEVWHDPDKQEQMNAVFGKVAEILT